MKYLIYQLKTEGDLLLRARAEYTPENEARVKEEAWGGKYSIEDDGITPPPSPQSDTDAMLIDHEYRLMLLELGLTESEV